MDDLRSYLLDDVDDDDASDDLRLTLYESELLDDARSIVLCVSRFFIDSLRTLSRISVWLIDTRRTCRPIPLTANLPESL